MAQLSTSPIAAPLPAAVETVFAPWTNVLLGWLAAGGMLLLVFPALRGVDTWFGWLPFWLVVAPAIDLVVARHRWIVERLRALLGQMQVRRRASRRQAKPERRSRRRSVRRTALPIVPECGAS